MTGLRQDDPVLTRRFQRRQAPHVPPAEALPFEGARVLEEIPGELGAFLFQRLRDVLLWSSLAGDERGRANLFRRRRIQTPKVGDLVEDEPIESDLRVLNTVVVAAAEADADQLGKACARVSQWAVDRSLYQTAYWFAFAASSILPLDPLLCVAAGRIARKQAKYELAKQWFRRAVRLARTSRRWNVLATTLISWATLELQRGNLGLARKRLMRAWRTARRYDLRHLAARAQHDLLQVTIDTGEWDLAETHAAAALDLYGQRAKNLVALAHDWAYLWLRRKHFSAALPVLEAVLPYITVPNERILALSSISRAAGALREAKRFEHAADSVLQLAGITSEGTPAALISVAEGAYAMGYVSRALEHAERALQLALGRDEKVQVEVARELVSRIRSGGPREMNEEPPLDSQTYARSVELIRRVQHGAARR